MKVDRLDTIITVQSKDVTGMGSTTTVEWSDLATVFCKWNDLNSIELIKSDTNQNICYAQVFIRQLNKLNATCRIIKNGEEWEIIGMPKKIDSFYELKVQRTVAG